MERWGGGLQNKLGLRAWGPIMSPGDAIEDGMLGLCGGTGEVTPPAGMFGQRWGPQKKSQKYNDTGKSKTRWGTINPESFKP